MAKELRLVYVTHENHAKAKALARKLLKERLVACVNILPHTEAVYWWKDRIEACPEAALLCKTTAKNVPKLIKRIKQLHPYDIPCVLSLKVEKGNPAYLNWLEKECR
ncbi:MAG: divalent-cation tolerance protein CutA [Candidatus Diapherotrites archaeon]|uniref:Divalent-cation tolerance protein CutA n=1 Tax=Candidatus Iainarchaeum sp. TaxID=3101447 RepID=A0A8T4L6A1_9ARCH|nr:divalent-cation tolerance protein CutA [Candidatus Diapherotrites archaeon]